MGRVSYLVYDGVNFSVRTVKGFKPKNAVAIVPDSFPSEDYPYLIGQQIDDGFGNMIWEVVLDVDAKNLDDIEKSKKQSKKDLYDQYLNDVENQMDMVFGTTDKAKSTSLYLTWLMMIDDPAFYSDKGLKDDTGKALDTNTKVLNYANSKILAAKDYSVFLIQRLEQYKTDDAAVG